MKPEMQELAQTWETLGEEDPLWAVATDPAKRGGRWDIGEFMKTGEQAVAHYRQLIIRNSPPARKFKHVLDFGCGVGRLTNAWSPHAEKVTGVDISAAMLQLAKNNSATLTNIAYVHNQNNDLRFLETGSADLVFSLICLQHMPWQLAADYLREFSRVCTAGGIVAFQLPCRHTRTNRFASIRKSFIENLPWGLGRRYRQWRYGSTTVFEMHYTPQRIVESIATTAGLKLLHAEPDTSAGADTEGLFYIFQKTE